MFHVRERFEVDQWDGKAKNYHITVYIDGEYVNNVYFRYDGHPVIVDDVHKIIPLMKLAYEAGKAGKEFSHFSERYD